MDRRTLLAASATAALGAAAGCVGAGGDSVSLTNTPEAVVAQYYHAADQADTRELFLDRTTPLVHSVSTFDLKLRVDTERVSWQRARRATIETVQVVEPELTDEQLVERVGFLGEELRPFFPDGRSAELAPISEQNALLRVSLAPEADAPSADLPGGRAVEWLLATDGGRRRLVWGTAGPPR